MADDVDFGLWRCRSVQDVIVEVAKCHPRFSRRFSSTSTRSRPSLSAASLAA